MKTEVYELVMFKGNPIRINKTQYQAVMEDSSSGKIGIVIGSEFVNFKNIANIRELEEQPIKIEHKQIEQPAKVKQNLEDMPNYQAYKKNMKLLLKGKLPRYIVVDENIVEKENYWHDDQSTKTDSIHGTWVKQDVSRQQWNTHYSQSPGYFPLDYTDDKVTIAFTTIPPISENVTTLTFDEINKVKDKVA
jgi:hypothetical protein